MYFILGSLGLWWAKAAFPVSLFVGFATYLFTTWLPRAAVHLISGDLGAFVLQDLTRMAVWVIGQLLQKANFWQFLGISATAIEAGTPLFWWNLLSSVAFFLAFTIAPILVPPIGVCDWITATSASAPYTGDRSTNPSDVVYIGGHRYGTF